MVVDVGKLTNTRKSHELYMRKFNDFCGEIKQTATPASPDTVVAYVRKLSQEKYSQSSIRSAISTIKFIHDLLGLVSPTNSPIVTLAKKMALKMAYTPPKQSKPLTIPILTKIMTIPRGKFKSQMIMARDKALISLMFFAALRESEAVGLRANEVWTDWVTEEDTKQQKEVLFVFVNRSKTDQAGVGDTVVIEGKEGGPICPIAAFKTYMQHRSLTSEYLFFNVKSGKKLSNTTPNHTLKRLLSKAEINPDGFTSHGARRGLATEAFKKQVDVLLLKRHGRWKSDAVYRYIATDTIESRLLLSRTILDA